MYDEWIIVDKELSSFDNSQKGFWRGKRLIDDELFPAYQKAAGSYQEIVEIREESRTANYPEQRRLLDKAAKHRLNMMIFVERIRKREVERNQRTYYVKAAERWDLIQEELNSFYNSQALFMSEKNPFDDELYPAYQKAAGSYQEIQEIYEEKKASSYPEQCRLLDKAAKHRVNMRIFVERFSKRENKKAGKD